MLGHMQVDHGGLDAFMAQQILDGDNVEAVFQQMGGISVAKRMHRHKFLDAGSFTGLVDSPLHASLGVAAVEVATGTAIGLAVEEPVLGRLSGYIGFKAPHQVLAQGHVAVLFAFSLADVEHKAVKVQIREADVAGLEAAQAAAVEQSQQHPVLEQLGSQQQAPDFLLAQDDGQGFIVFDAGQLDMLVFEAFHAEDKAQAVDGELKVGQRGRIMLLAQQVEIIIDLVGVELGRQAVEVQGQLGQVAGVVGKGTLAPAGDGDFLAELLVKLAESCYISTGSLNKGLLFFFILISVKYESIK